MFRGSQVSFVVVMSALSGCRSESRKDAPVPAAPEEQEDGEVQMAAPLTQAASGIPLCLPQRHTAICVT